MKPLNLAIICGSLLMAGVLFWPTLYRYDKTNPRSPSTPPESFTREASLAIKARMAFLTLGLLLWKT
jgi:hypothetical protein